MKNLTSNDLVGKAFFPVVYKNGNDFFDRYFSLLDTTGKKLREFESNMLITGFYTNHIDDADIKHSLRVTYFVTDKNKLIVEEEFKKISNDNKNNESPEGSSIDKESPPNSFFESIYPNIENLRGRQFLNTYSQIGLDLLEKLGAKSVYDLISRYKLKIIIDPQQKLHDDISSSKEDIKLTFADVFKKNSDFFNKLNSTLYPTDNLWEDLARYRYTYKSEGQYGIGYLGHFLVNMFLIPDKQVLILS